jgi:catechol 2,3-dioxygenase-like lactoylglutathione lyase family enzyme
MSTWPDTLPVAQVRIARATRSLAKMIAFYHDGLGLRRIAEFKDHAGYSGIMFGLPDDSYHLEFTECAHHAASCQAPTRDNLLVLYIPDRTIRQKIQAHLHSRGYPPVPAENPYWDQHGVTFEDPEGWRVVLVPRAGFR